MIANKIRDLIEKSSLNSGEKEEFIKICSSLGADEQKGLAELFEKDLTWVAKLYENFKLKKDHFTKKGGDDAWQSIVGQEVDDIKSLVE